MEESFVMRMLLNILYSMMLLVNSAEEESYAARRTAFLEEIQRPICKQGYPNLGLFMLELVFLFEKCQVGTSLQSYYCHVLNTCCFAKLLSSAYNIVVIIVLINTLNPRYQSCRSRR